MKNQLFKIKLASIALSILLSNNINSQSPCQLILSKTPTTTICAGSQVTLGVSAGSQNSGNGSDGSITISSTTNADAVKSSVNGIIGIAGSNSIALTSASGFSVGNEVLIITMQDATVGANNLVGKYELKTISAISSNTLIFSQNLLNTYTASAAVKHQVIKVPQYTSVTVNNGGVLTCDAWNGTVGGVLCFKANGAVTINSGGSISANGKGYRGVTQKVALWRNANGGQGEGFYGTGIPSGANGSGNCNNSAAWNLANGNGGGGGTGCGDSGGGGGGSYATAGGIGTNWGHTPGDGGNTVGNTSLTLVYMGGAGGEGGADEDGAYNGAGGNGGGIVIISTNSIVATGTISSIGNNGNDGSNGSPGSGCGTTAGGGGAGGSILLQINSFSGSGSNVLVGGGLGGNSTGGCNGVVQTGGNGGTGRIRIDITGSVPVTNPAAYQGTNTIASGVAYSWSNGSIISTSNSVVVSPSITTNYTITITTTSGCSGASSVIAVNVNPNPTITVNNGTICVGQNFTINPNGANTYTIQGGNAVVSPPSNSSYTVIGTNSVTGCVSQAFATSSLIVNANPIITVNSGAICAGQNFTINPNGANTYTIQGGNPVVSPAVNSSYTVAGTSTAGCVSQAVAISSLIVNPNPIITVNNGTICVGQNFTINPNGANTYTIQGGSAVVSPPSNASFTVAGTSAAGCVSQAVATSSLLVNPNPTITVNNGTICAGQNFTINPNGANTYTIQGGNPVVSPPSNAIFTVAGTSTAGCVSQAVAISSLIVNQNPIITVNNGTICAGQNFTINPNGANTYTIQGGNAVVSPPSNAIFTVAGTSTAGCVSQAVATSSLIVNVNPTITVNSGAICAGQNFTINPNGANTYTIQGANAVVSPSVNTTYTVIGTNTITGCRSQSFATSNLTVNPNPTVSISGASGICTGQNASLTANGATTYTWSTGSNSASIVTTPTANTTYTLTGSTPQGCSSFTTQLVTVQLSLSVSIAGPTTVCYGEPANISGLGGVTYTWNTGATSSTIAPTLTTTTTFSLIGASGTCSNTASTTISVTPNPTVTITGTNAICANGTTSLTVNGATTYTWSSGSTSASVVFSPSATSVYSVVGSYSTGCLNATTQTVTVYTLPVVSISGPSVVCLGDSIALVANGANTYLWNNNATTTTIVITPTTTSTYSAVGTDTNGCVGLSEIDSIFVNPVPIISIASTATTICVGEGVTLTANGANTYTWTGGINTNSIAVSPSVSTTYSASGSGTNSCVGRNTLQIIVSECTNIKAIASKTSIKVYPNPNNGEFTIELTNINNSNITITNVLGQIIKSQKAELINQINLNAIDKGIYFINVMENNQSVFRGSMIKE